MFLFGARKNIYTAPFLDAQEPGFLKHFDSECHFDIFVYISVRKFLFQRRRKGFIWGGGLGEAESLP